MIVKFWLKIGRNGSINTTKTKPFTTQNEIATFFEVEIPDAIFTKPQLSVKAKIGEDYKLPEIKAEVVTDIENYIVEKTGLNLEVKILPVEEQTK